MKRNVFLPEGADFSRSEVDKDAESIKYEARVKLSNLRGEANKESAIKAPRKKADKMNRNKEEPKSYADILKSVQKNKK